VRRAQTPQDQIAIAQMLGFTKEWVPLLEQGAGTIAGLGEEARRAGAVIDDATVQRAADFDWEWRKSSVEFEAYMKAALSGLLPIIDDLIEQAGKFISSFDSKAIRQAADENLKQFRDATGVPDSGGIHIDTDNLARALQVWQDSPIFSLETWREFGRAFSSSVQLLGPEDLKWLQGSGSAVSDTSPQALLAGASSQNFWNAQLAALKGMSADVSGVGGFTKIPGRDDGGKDGVDRAIDSLRKHTEQQLADAQAVGLGDAALARFRATAAETAAVQANGGKETDEQAKKFAALKDAAAAAAEALARAKVSSQIDFNNKTMLLLQDDVAIASQLKGIYGNDVPAALASSEASALRLNTAFRGLSSSIENDMVNSLTDITTGTKSAGQGFADFETAAVRAVEQVMIKMMIVEPLMRSLQSMFSGGINLSSFGFNPIAGVTGSAKGNIFAAGHIVPFADGGIPDVVSMPTIAPMALFGEKGEEAIMPLRRDSSGRLGVSAGAGGGSTSVVVNVHNAPAGVQSQTSRMDGQGNVAIDVILKKAIDGAVAESLSNGSGGRVLADDFGVKRFMGR
jgi:hypothetical protein